MLGPTVMLFAYSSPLPCTRQAPVMVYKHLTWYGLDSAASELQFPQECLEFPPLCNTRLAGSRFDEWISSFTGGNIPTHVLSLWRAQATSLNPRQMNYPSSSLGPLKTGIFIFRGCMFRFKHHISNLTLPFLHLLVCHLAESSGFCQPEKKSYITLSKLHQTEILIL